LAAAKLLLLLSPRRKQDDIKRKKSVKMDLQDIDPERFGSPIWTIFATFSVIGSQTPSLFQIEGR
jgi:hypothetical protein